MAIFRRRTTLLLLLSICLLSVAMRYPLVEHERHNDTFNIHSLSSSIAEKHYAMWTFSPLSYFGYYPASYPSGLPFLLAELSELTGLRIELAILIENMFVGVFFAVVVFALAREFVQRPEFVLLALLFGAVGPRFVDTSYWNGSSRAIFVALAVFVVFVALKSGSSGKFSLFVVVALSFVGCVALHHMAVLFLLFGLAYVLAFLGAYLSSKSRLFGHSRRLAKGMMAAFLIGIFALILAVSVFSLGYYSRGIIYTFEETNLFSLKPPWLSIILNMAASYINQIGFALPVAILGIPFLVSGSRLSTKRLLLVVLPLVFIPLLASSLYIAMLLTPFIAILATICLSQWLPGRRRMLVAVLCVLLICISLVLPFLSSNRWNSIKDTSGDAVEVDDQVYNDAAYLREYSGKTFLISNADTLSYRLSALSGTLTLTSGAQSALSGDVTAGSVRGNLSWSGQKFPNNLYQWFEYRQNPEIVLFVLLLIMSGSSYSVGHGDTMPSGVDYFELHSRLLVAIDNNWPSSLVWVYGSYPAKLPMELRNAEWQDSRNGFAVDPLQSYLLYGSERVSLYALEVPA